MKRFTRISMALLVCAILAAITGCSKISRIKNSISGDKFTEIAEDYGLEVGKKENSSITTYIAQGNDIYAEFYVLTRAHMSRPAISILPAISNRHLRISRLRQRQWTVSIRDFR